MTPEGYVDIGGTILAVVLFVVAMILMELRKKND
jgi:hypothetical protein